MAERWYKAGYNYGYTDEDGSDCYVVAEYAGNKFVNDVLTLYNE